ncbi:MAG: cytochrome c3 family protein [Terriglobia bacterium]
MRAIRPATGSLPGLHVFGWVGLAQEQGQHPAVTQSEEAARVEFCACAKGHADKTAGAGVHPALELGCKGCHQVERVGGETESPLAVEGNDLCLTCHEAEEASPQEAQLDQPFAASRCSKCHNPHTANGSANPLVAETASATPLCLQCHDK